MNYGLVLISPMILVRLLSESDFGRYREFLVYVTLLTGIASFGINSSLLRFVPHDPRSTWCFVNQAVAMTFVSSAVIVGAMLLLNALFDGRLVGEYAFPVALYVLVSVNLDFWEFLWLAERRSSAVLRYSTARLVARIIVVTGAAALTRDVRTIIWALIGLEGARLMISGLAWLPRAYRAPSNGAQGWREQWRYCFPFGSALTVATLAKSMAPLFVAKVLGPAALAQFVIGTYLQPVVNTIRNSLSDVVLPEMSAKKTGPSLERLDLWRRTSIVTAILLFGPSVVLARFADVLIVTLFSETYRPAVVVFQIYLLMFLREALDLGVPLRAINRNAPILYSNLIAALVAGVLLILMIPAWGLIGAVTAVVISRFIEGAYLATQLAHAYELRLSELAPWKDLLKVLFAALLAGVVLLGDFWNELGFFGIVPAGLLYLIVFAVLLSRLNVQEAHTLLSRLRSTPALVLRRLQ